VKTYHWDFFGPRAGPTAEHFLRHLDGFLREHAITDCATGTASEGARHHGVFCRPSDTAEELIVTALRPNRVVEEA
jgi:hypothetical protein